MNISRYTALAQLATAVALVTVGACGGSESSRTGVVIDSALPRDVEIANFQRDRTPVTEFSGGAESREELVRRFFRAVSGRDTAELSSMLLTVEEYAFLYYETAFQATPPRSLPPDLLWFMQETQSRQGISRLLDEYGGREQTYISHACGENQFSPRTEGENTVWGFCVSKWIDSASGDTVSGQIFGLVVERGGVWKFVTYNNDI